MLGGGDGVLPDQFFPGYFWAQIACTRAHVAVGQLEPGAGKGFGESLWVFKEAARDLLVGRVHAQRQVGGQHGGLLVGAAMCVGDDIASVLGNPLNGTGRAFFLHPFVLEQVLEEEIAPLCRSLGPGHFQARGDGIAGLAGLVAAGPAQALGFQAGGFGLGAHMAGGARTMGLAEGVAAGDQRHGFLVIHGHAGKGVADVMRGREGVAIAVRAFGVDIDQTHLHGGQRVLEVALAAVAAVRVLGGGQPFLLCTPVHVLIGFPGVHATAAEAEGAKSHGFQCDVAAQHHQVAPGNLVAVFLLDRPQQAARLVDVDVVRPAVERRKALLGAARAAATVLNAIGAGCVPGHADELGAVVAEVGRPPVLRVGHQGAQIALDGFIVQLLEGLGVVEVFAQGVAFGGVLAQQIHAQLIGPPVLVAGGVACGGGFAVLSLVEGALGFSSHGALRFNDPTGR